MHHQAALRGSLICYIVYKNIEFHSILVKNGDISCIFDYFVVSLQPNLENCIHMKRYLVGLVAALVCSMSAWAVMATPEPFEYTKPDGTKVMARIYGDEVHSYIESLDGELLYGSRDAASLEAAAQVRRARRVAQQKNISGSYPLSGSPKSLVILVNFKDLAFQYKLEDFQKMLNESGYSANNGVGSARDYFIACSDSVFSPVFDCYGPVTVSKEYAYYGQNVGSSNSAHASQMVVEACNLVSDLGVDLTQYDTDNDGRLDNVFVYFAGHNEAEGASANTIWPHRSIVGGNERVQGKLIYDYACTSEMRGTSGKSMCGIGTFCHEFGHVLGLPDYYDTDYKYYSVGTWDIMCSGSYNGHGKTPPSYSAGERFQLGWLTPVQLNDAGYYELQPLATHNEAYLIAKTQHNLSFSSANPNEYWLLENRQHVGWDAPASALPGTGMVIFHIDYSAYAWNMNEPNNSLPLRYDIEEAGGSKGYSAASDPFPGTLKVAQFTPILHSGEIVEQPLYNISDDNQIISFLFKSSDFMILPTDLPVIQSTYNPDNKEAYTPASLLKIAGEGLDPEMDVTIGVNGSGFTISTDSLNWTTSLAVRPTIDSTMDQPIYVRYNPKKVVCEVKRGTVFVRQDKKAGSYIVQGTCPRPTLIEPPYVSYIEEVTPTSFKYHWTPEPDAEEYYVTLYHMEPGEETMMEGFEGFDDPVTVTESGWYTSFYRTTSKAKEEGSVSLWLKENYETVMTPVYPLPVTKISFWLSAPATTDTEVGFIRLVAIGETGTDTLENIQITKSTKKYVYERQFDISKGYRRFWMEYTSLGGDGVCMDAFATTFNQKIVYTYKGREKTIMAQEGDLAEDYAVFYAYDLIPDMTYYVRMQCSENKGCTEHLSELSEPTFIQTKKGESIESKHLTLDYDSISYDPATHVIYIPQSLKKGTLGIYDTKGELVAMIPVGATCNVVPLNDNDFRRGTIYIVKYMPEDKMKRKGQWIKILFQ